MCGIFGTIQQTDQAFFDIYESLSALQHRGQDASGIVTFDGRFFYTKKEKGLAKDVFTKHNAKRMLGKAGLGHVRYKTAGTTSVKEAQPFFVNAPFGIQLIHNGNLVHVDDLRDDVTKKYFSHLKTESDTEVLLHVLAGRLFHQIANKPASNIDMLTEAVCNTMDRVSGAYSVIALVDKIGLVAFRDPHGIRPLVLGKRIKDGKTEWAVASEDVAFASIGFSRERDVTPGEVIIIDFDGNLHTKQCVTEQHTTCVFEYVYLARPDANIDGISVYGARLRLGEYLARQIEQEGLDIDVVMPIPSSSRPAAVEVARHLQLPYREGIIKSRYVGRTFIMPDQQTREKSVRRKLNAIPSEFEGKNVLLVDDSIARGTTMRQVVEMCRSVGAKKVYVASAAPPVRHPNVYGVNLPTREELIAHNRTLGEIQVELGVDKLFYQTIEDMRLAISDGDPNILFDDSCFSGDYVTGDVDEDYIKHISK